MDRKQFLKQAVDFQKSSFNNGFDAVNIVQEQTEKITGTFIEQASWIPEEGKKAMAQWVEMYKKGRDEFRKAVDEGFNRVDEYFKTFEPQGK